jgi:hypothetical protein
MDCENHTTQPAVRDAQALLARNVVLTRLVVDLLEGNRL